MNRTIALAALMASCPIIVGQGDDAAIKTLVKALDSQRDVRVCMVQVRSNGDLPVTVSVQIVPRVGVRAAITQPLVYAGIVSFDNGESWKNFDPQTNVVRIEKSPASFQLDVERRRKLIEKNFETTFGGEAMVAGRKTRVVVMKGKHEGMASRRIYIDAENSLILRYIVTQPDSAPLTTVDTKSIDLVQPIDAGELSQIGGERAKVVKAWGPIEVRQAKDTERYAGFAPEIPPGLPAGLETQAIHVVGTEARPFVGVRLTDGMAVVTVYLWRAKVGESPEQEPFKGDFDARGANGTRCKVVGEVSDAVRASLAKSFARLCEGPSLSSGTLNGTNSVLKEGNQWNKGREGPRLVYDNE